jgi:hypothetical protein
MHLLKSLCSPAQFLILFFLVCQHDLYTQDALLPLNSPSERKMEQLQIQGVSNIRFSSSLKPYRRGDLFDIAYDLALHNTGLSYFDAYYILSDNDEFYPRKDSTGYDSIVLNINNNTQLLSNPPVSKKSFLRIFYTRPAHLFALDEKDFYLRVNPILHFSVGKEKNDDGTLFINRRGVELRGGIDQSVFFSTQLIETQLRPASYIRQFEERYHSLPDAGLYKDFDSRIFDSNGAYDYLFSSGYVGFRISKHVGLQLGHGKNFIGDGYRSLLLSDFAKNYFYLKLNTRVWRFHYQNLFAELSAREKLPGNVVVPKKYLAAHYLSFDISKTLSVGLFESVVFAREENRFELQYLNPVILYRSIEHHVGSPDNVFVGLTARWDLANTVRLYSQFVLDEFKFAELFSNRGWWGNKNGLQFGVKYINVLGISQLDAQLEYNRVRPYTYSHYDSLGSYSHFNQPLAHPVGANFNEILFKLDYRPHQRLWLTGKLFLIEAGTDTDSVYFGADILHSNEDRTGEFGVHQRQGVAVSNGMFSFTATYMIKHNLFLEGTYFRRDYDSDEPQHDLLSQYFTVGIRWNYFESQTEF